MRPFSGGFRQPPGGGRTGVVTSAEALTLALAAALSVPTGGAEADAVTVSGVGGGVAVATAVVATAVVGGKSLTAAVADFSAFPSVTTKAATPITATTPPAMARGKNLRAGEGGGVPQEVIVSEPSRCEA
ncbi:MAG: hypothetical protein JNK04_16615, partial [Myxococcales bacterium]|nr:hypothetical protein [Myxococcales bacterium]